MLKKIQLTFLLLFALLFSSNCTKELEEYNKPALYWYSKMVDSIGINNLEKADDYYTSLQGEHIGSPLLPTATQIIAQAHFNNEEYLLADYFYDEYIKRYANDKEKEFYEFKKIEAKYKSLPLPRRDQKLIRETIALSQTFLQTYPYSNYYSQVDTIRTRLLLGISSLNRSIASLYNRIDKYKSAKFYEHKDEQKWIDWNDVEIAHSPWYREWFEGDGYGSWYGFLIPNTQSVVSRNSNKDTNITQ